MSRTAGRVLRIAGSGVLLAVVISLLPAGELQHALRQASPAVLAISLVVFLVCHVAAAFKWRMLMGRSTDVSFDTAVRAHFTGLVGTLTPLGMIGGDVVRAGVAINRSTQSSAIVVMSVVDRLVDTAALLALALAGVVWMGGRSTGGPILLWGGVGVAGVGLAALVAGHALLTRARHPRLAGLREALAVLRTEPTLIARALLLSILIQGSFVTANAYIGTSVGVESSFAAWLFAWPAAKFTAYLPVTVAGIGVRETALIALLTPAGGAPAAIMAAGLLWDAVLVAGSIAGWCMLCVCRATPQQVLDRVQSS